MVLQKTVDNLKSRPRHERRAVARGIAIAVVAILFIGWIILFFRNIQANGIQIEPIGTTGLNTAPLTEAQNQIVNSFSDIKDNLQAIQNSTAAQSQGAQDESASQY
ncbi:MAG: hypothetical protein Q7S08_02680 [bacterium]|nr:hypothetical protein [bacterium]